MKLKKLFKDVKNAQVKSTKDPEITGICSNSKLVSPGNLFIARKGLVNDGSQYITEAIHSGASAVLTDMYNPSLKEIIQVIHPNPADIEVFLAATYYRDPSNELFMVGITGTNGKTTTSFLIKYLFDQLGLKKNTGLIGTIEYIVGEQRYPAIRTTPDIISNQKMLREMCNQKCKSAVLEVTSHALDQGRVKNIHFDVAVFTNLTQDHLDYHIDMDSYCAAKNILFRSLEKDSWAVINRDSPWTPKMIEGCSSHILTYGIEDESDLKATDVEQTTDGSTFILHYYGKTYSVTIPLIGKFNIYNCLAAIGVCIVQGHPLERILPLLTHCPSTPGRLERVPNPQDRKIYVDFAHTSDALENVLKCLADLAPKKIITVFGCGGDRDKTKRPLMAAVAEAYSDFSIVTSDNPRTEDPEKICKEIVMGFKTGNFKVEVDRKKAILEAIEMASSDDIILIAGKGHEISQIFAHKTIEFNDLKIAQELCTQKAIS